MKEPLNEENIEGFSPDAFSRGNSYRTDYEVDMTQKPSTPEHDVAVYCFIAAEKIIATLAGEQGPKLSGNSYWDALTETVCCALHLIDRALFESIPDERNARMSRLFNECLKIMPQGMYDLSELSKEEVDAEAEELLLSIYTERMEEYAKVGDDWLNKILLSYGRHVTESLREIDFSYKTITQAQMQMTILYTGLMEVVPEFFK